MSNGALEGHDLSPIKDFRMFRDSSSIENISLSEHSLYERIEGGTEEDSVSYETAV